MAKIIVPLAPGFEEIEAVSIIDICRRADIEVLIAAIDNLQVIGANNITLKAQILIEDMNLSDIDMIVLPGGAIGAHTLASNKIVQDILKKFKEENKFIAAICAAPYALHTAGVLNKNYTCYPSYQNQIRQDGYIESKNIVRDEKIITSRGPSTAMCFALEIVKILTNQEIYESVKKGLLANHC